MVLKVPCLVLLVLFQCFIQTNGAIHKSWAYHDRLEDYNSPFKWDTVPGFEQCNHKHQSPVNIPWEGDEIRDIPDIFPALNLTGECLWTTMHDDGAAFKFDINGGTCAATGAQGKDVEYLLHQFVYHTPSEHQINGKTYDGEVQFIHTTKDGKKTLGVAVFLDASLEVDSTWVSQTFDSFGHENKNIHIGNVREKFIPVRRGKWFNYQGSLTEPPCTDDVDWWVSAIPVRISRNQLEELVSHHKDKARMDHGTNVRNIMPVNGRDIKPLTKSWAFDHDDGYTDEEGWNELYPACGTMRDFTIEQSPIDFLFDVNISSFEKVEPFLEFNNIGCNKYIWEADLDQTTYKWKIDMALHDICEASGSKMTRRYVFKEIEFVTPSEHTVNSHHYDAEVKFIHQTTDGKEFLVVSVLLEAKASLSNTWIMEILDPFYYDNRHNKKIPVETSIPYSEFLPLDEKWFNYHGSITRPPCSETADVWVAAKPIQITVDELKHIEHFHKLLDRSKNGKNARKTQDANGRLIKPVAQPWAYNDKKGFLDPSKWRERYPTCKGEFQSPIDIEYHGDILELPHLDDLKIRVSGCKNFTFVKHHDHTVYEWDINVQGDICSAKGADINTEYDLEKFTAHSPSEHTYNAEYYDAEFHFEHVSHDHSKKLIIAVFIEGTAEEDHPWVEDIFQGFAHPEHKQVLSLHNAYDALIPYGNDKKWFNYQGSYTTPPCTENVDWWVSAEAIKISPKQLQLLKSNQKYMIRNLDGANARLTQDIIGREIRPLGHPWAYHARHEYLPPHRWNERYPECGGDKQSPINFVFEGDMEFLPVIEPPLGITVEGCKTVTWFGHHDHTDYKWLMEKEKLDSCKATGSDQSISYDLLQFHIHVPSEHTINNKHYDGEVHFVHADEATGRLLVIGVFLEIDDVLKPEGDSFIQDIIEGFSHNPLDHFNTFNLRNDYDTFIPIASGWFNYQGSLTTPPCSEIVDWWVTALPVKVNTAQIEFIRKNQLLQDRTDYAKNNRVPQPINSRIVQPLLQPWAYHSNHGYLSPPDWQTRYPDCGGDNQSPIDIQTRGMDLQALATPFPHLAIFVGGCNSMTWVGHPDNPYYKWEVNVHDDTCQATGRYEGIKYTYEHMTVHSPSEHRINGQSFDAELQFEHISTDGSKKLIVSLMVVASASNENKWVAENLEGLSSGLFEIDFELNNSHESIIPMGYNDRWFNYEGSVTKPPCTENVEWWITTQPIAITVDQLKILTLGQEKMSRSKNGANNRPIYPQNGRKVKPMDGGGYVDLAALAAGGGGEDTAAASTTTTTPTTNTLRNMSFLVVILTTAFLGYFN